MHAPQSMQVGINIKPGPFSWGFPGTMHSTGQTVTQLPSRTHKLVMIWVMISPMYQCLGIVVLPVIFVKLRFALQLALMQTSTEPSKRHQPIIATAAGILFVSTASIFIRFAQAEASSIVIAAARLLIASVVLIPIALIRYRQEWRRLSRSDLVKGGLIRPVSGPALCHLDQFLN
jgi:hypothetical protein